MIEYWVNFSDATPVKKSRKSKRMRLPNGFGTISEIKGKDLRNPFRAMVTVGKDEKGKPVRKPLKPQSYFHTYNDAYAALIEYNKNPYDLTEDTTCNTIFERWFEQHCKTASSSSSISHYQNAWKYCSAVYNMPVRDIRARHIKGCMENGIAMIWGKPQTPPVRVKKNIKILFNQMLDYALEYELVDKNYARTFNLPDDIVKEINTVTNEHIAYSDEEIDTLWKHTDDLYVQMLLVQCYSGWRPKELMELAIENINLDEWTFMGGVKTDAGKDRIVPIHSAIRDIVTEKYNEAVNNDSMFLFNRADANGNIIPIDYATFNKELARLLKEYNLNTKHRLHDGRTHFVTTAKKSGLDEYAIKYIVGHKISDITEKVYTKRELDWLKTEIEKIKVGVAIV